MRLDINELSSQYTVSFLTAKDVDIIYDLAAGNPLFYQYCPPFVTKESILKDMKALPPKMTYKDKYYIGFFDHTKLITIMDLITKYPNASTAFIGLFMVEKTEQGKGTGTKIIDECFAYFRTLGYAYVRLGYVKGNMQSENFWKKNGFIRTGIESMVDTYTVVVMQRELG